MLRMVLQALNQTALYSVGRSMGGGGEGSSSSSKILKLIS